MDVTLTINKLPSAEGGHGRILKCWYQDCNSQIETIAKMIDEYNRIGESIMEGVIMSSIIHPHIVNSIRPPIIHTFYQKRLLHEVEAEQSHNVQLPNRPGRRLRSLFTRRPSPPVIPPISPIINKNLHADQANDVKWKRVLYFQEEAVGDLDDCPWIGRRLEVTYIAWQILNAVYAMHNENIIHVDIKPSNILYYHDDKGCPVVKLTDFSLSVINNGKNRGMAGSPCYAAPEALAEDEWDEKIDIWSLGCTLYYLYYGRTLFPIQKLDIEDDVERRRARRIRELKAIVDWSRSSTHANRVINVNQFDRVEECHLFEKNSVNDLLMSMLLIDAERRSSVRDLLHSDIFTARPRIISYGVADLSAIQLDQPYLNTIKNMCYTEQGNLNEILYRTAVKLCSRIWDLVAIMNPDELIASAVSISYTLINGCILTDLGSNDDNDDIILLYTGLKILCVLNERG